MKKLTLFVILFALSCILSSCPGDGSTTYMTIKTANALLYSFDENGIFPYLDDFKKNELGIGVYADSITERIEYAQFTSGGTKAYAMSNPNELIYLNTIESLNVFTKYDFDANHPAGSNVNDILLFLNHMGETTKLDVSGLSAVSHHFKFSSIPQNDSLQFEITGIITDEGVFNAKTKLVIID